MPRYVAALAKYFAITTPVLCLSALFPAVNGSAGKAAPMLFRAAPTSQPVPRFEPASLDNFPVSLAKNGRNEVGYLVVWEDRAKQSGRTIRLPVAIVRTENKTPAPDPVVYTAGGPGSSSLRAAEFSWAYRFTDTRDFIVFEQRGTRFSEPALDCPEVVTAKTQAALNSLPVAERIAREAQAAQVCRKRLVASGINPAAYTTAASAADLEDLRRVLKIPQWNLYGTSYSTRLMLAVMRDYPDGVRSAVLDSVLAPNEPYDTTIAQHFVEALEAVFRDCEAQDACRTAYPNLKARFYAALEQAERSPLTVSVSPPTTNGKTGETPSAQPVQVRLGSTELLRLVDISNTDALPSLPRLIDQIARRDAVALGPVAQNSLQPSGYAWGMRYSVWCGEEVVGQEKGRQTAQNVTSSVPPVLARVSMSTVPADVCKTWKVPPVPRSGLAPVRSLIPTLLIAGEYDPYTPAKWANAAAKTLPNGRVLTLKGMSHTPTQVWGQPCAMVVAATFVENPNNDPTRSAKGKCLESCRPPTFTTESATKQR